MGLPTKVPGFETTSLPLRCYLQTYNDWYRDQNYNDMVTVPVDDGPDVPADFMLLNRNKRYDYFTSSLPFPQKGPNVTIPLEGNAPVISNLENPLAWAGDTTDRFIVAGTTTNTLQLSGAPLGSPQNIQWGTETGMEADLSGVAAVTINALRLAATTQQIYEQDMRGGTRYTEVIRSHFGIISPDQRLQRVEFLGSSTTRVNVTPVAQTSGTGVTDQDTPQANLAAFGVVNARGGFTYSFQETWLCSWYSFARADYTYWQGAERFWFRSARFDFYWPSFAHIGEQAVLQREIFASGTADDEIVFGYQEYAADYRFKPARLSGLFRPNATNSLDALAFGARFYGCA